MLSTSVLDSDLYRAGEKPVLVASMSCPSAGILAGPQRLAGPRRDPPSPTPPRPTDEQRPLTLDDIARIGDTKADESEDGEGQSSTKGTGSAG